MPALGLRLDQRKDPRSARFSLDAVTEPNESALPNSARWLSSRAPLDQGNTSTCTAHAAYHFLSLPPIVQVKANRPPSPWDLYRRIVLADEWTDNDSEATLPDADPRMAFGSSTLAVMKTLQVLGYIGAYLWAWSVETISRFVRMQGKNFANHLGGPVIVGTAWYTSMFHPDAQGVIRIAPNSQVAGGHEWVICGANQRTGMFRMRNSWGPSWGRRGEALISFEDVDRLLRENGDAVTTNELRLAA